MKKHTRTTATLPLPTDQWTEMALHLVLCSSSFSNTSCCCMCCEVKAKAFRDTYNANIEEAEKE